MLVRALAALISASFAVLLATPAVAGSPYQWRAYPNGDRTIAYGHSSEWLLLAIDGAPAVAPLEHVLGKAAPAAVLVDVREMVPGRLAVRVGGLDVGTLAAVGQALVEAGVAAAAWPAATRETGVGFFDDRLAIAFREAPRPGDLVKAGVVLIEPTPLPGVWSARAIDGDAVGAAWALKGNPAIRWAEPDLIRDIDTYDLPDDPRVGEQWHLTPAGGSGSINAEAAWAITSGDPQVVMGIFDTGYDMDHPDLLPNIVGGFDAASNDGNPEAECGAQPDGAGPAGSCPANAPFRESHGTAVAGVVAARGNNTLLGTGVCPDCSLFPVRLLGGSGFRSLSNAAAFQRAADEGVWVINNSWGPGLTRFFPLSSAEEETFTRISTEGRNGLGVVLVFAAGNDYFTPANSNPYAAHPGVITVSASTQKDDFACYSNYGSVIAIAGPSRGCFDGEGGIATTDYVGNEGYDRGDFTTGFGGTSAASPVVAGVAGLVLAANPSLTAQQVRLVLQRTAAKIRADRNPWQREFGLDLAAEFDYDENGFSKGFGYGRVDAGAAVALAVAPPDLVAAVCDDACPRCFEGRCAPDCAADADCPGAARCLDMPGGGRGCAIPHPAPTDVGQPCIAECEVCTLGFDSEQRQTRVCSAHCEGDADCPFGFDCRTLHADAPKACVPGNAECGTPWGDTRCQSEIRVSGGGVDYCTCDCVPDAPGACPDGFLCSWVQCEQRRGGIYCEAVDSPRLSNFYPTCVPDPTFRAPCSTHGECPGGLFCIDGICQADTAREGCDICAPCESDGDCFETERCVAVPRGKRCLQSCMMDNPRCPGDSECVNLPGPEGDYCVNPEWRRKGYCPQAYRCLVEGRCFIDEDCADGACVDNRCEGAEQPEPDAALPDASAAPADAGVDAAPGEPDVASNIADVGQEQEERRRRPSGCSAAPGASSAWLALLLLGLRRRRRAGHSPE